MPLQQSLGSQCCRAHCTMGKSTAYSRRLGKESGEFPADLLNTAPQCFSRTSLLLNATAAHMHFCYFSAPGTTVPSPLGTSAPLWPGATPQREKYPVKAIPTIRTGLVLINSS